MTDEVTNAKPKSKPEKRTTYLPVRLIKATGKSALVEWHEKGHAKRGFIPINKFDPKNAKVDQDLLAAAIPYGVDWSKADIKIDPVAIDQELKKRGIWTVDDLKSQPQVVNVVIMRAVGLGRSALIKLKE